MVTVAQAEEFHIPSRVLDSQSILHQMASDILDAEEQPVRATVETFLVAYESFQNSLRRLEQDSLLADFGIDALTGLRSKSVMIPDLERELERRARRGQPFCFVVSRIDGETAQKDPEKIKKAAKCIEKTIRSFDDAYVTADGEFLSSLKHSDNNGGLKFVVRLNEILKNEEGVTFTMSSCVAEPLPGDNISQLIINVRKDLDDISSTSRSALGQYEDISPLSRYIQSIKDSQ